MAGLPNRSRRFVDALEARFVRAPFEASWWMGYGYVGVRIRGPRSVTLTDLWVEERFRRKKKGRKMLKHLCQLADNHRVTIVTYVQPFDNGTRARLNAQQLAAWYARYGFVAKPQYRTGQLYREPRRVRPA